MERVLSLVMVGTTLFMGLMWGGGALFMGLLALFDSPMSGLCIWACGLPPALLGPPLVIMVLRFSRSGSAGSYLEQVQQALGVPGELESPSLVMPLITPRWEASVEGRTVSVMLRRTAGILSPISPSGGMGIPWTMTVQVDCSQPGKIAFTDPSAVTVGVGLLGLSDPQTLDGLQVFAGGAPAVASDEAVLQAARALPYGSTTLARTTGTHLELTERMSELPPEALAERVRALVALAGALESAA
jgi:hypothetical protein